MKKTAVICDDDPVVRAVVADMVARQGWEPVELATAHAAIQLAPVLAPDLVVLDVALPGMSGLDAAPQIARSCPAARIVVLTSFDVPPGARARAGAVEVVSKHQLVALDGVLERLRERTPLHEGGLERLYDAVLNAG